MKVKKKENIPPGSEKRTDLFPLKRSSVVTSFHLKGLLLVSDLRDSSRTLALKVTLGIISPSLILVERVVGTDFNEVVVGNLTNGVLK